MVLADSRIVKKNYNEQMVGELNRIFALELSPEEHIRQIDTAVEAQKELFLKIVSHSQTDKVDLLAISDRRLAGLAEMSQDERELEGLFRAYADIIDSSQTPQEQIKRVDLFIAQNRNKFGGPDPNRSDSPKAMIIRSEFTLFQLQRAAIYNQHLSPQEHIRQLDALLNEQANR